MTVFTYAKCDTCRKAVKWLNARGLSYEEIPIRETPPSPEQLRQMLAVYEGNLKRLFNTSGKDYRELGLGSRLASISEEEAISLLAGNGNLVKRPFLITKEGGLVGFKEAEWEALFS